VEILKSLMKDQGLTASGLGKIIEVSKSHVSEILNYKKGLSKEVIRKLAAHFKVNQEAFNRPYRLQINQSPLATNNLLVKGNAKGKKARRSTAAIKF
jgi:plasmid maintenance system antidote protein VapI